MIITTPLMVVSTAPTYCLGDMIWKDIDQDGIQDDGEEGVADVNITLYNSSNEELGTDTTDSGGKYEFCNLSSDDYYIVVDNLHFQMGMRLLLKTKEMMTITIVISTQMMGRVILLPSPMIITTPLMVVSTLQPTA